MSENANANVDALKGLVAEWCKWHFKLERPVDPADDNTGTIVKNQNANNAVWFLPGTWGRRMSDDKVRDVKVPEAKRLLVIVGSSHAIPIELGKQDASEAELKARVVEIEKKWTKKDLLRDGNPEQLQRVEVYIPSIEVSKAGYYAQGLANFNNPTKMYTAAHVKMYNNLKKGGAFNLRVEAHSDPYPEINEPDYDILAKYSIKVE